MQFDQGHKGFSFSKDGPLDMRMDPDSPLTAEEIVNQWPEKKLGEIFKEWGEEPRWRQAAKVICEERRRHPIRTTGELAQLLKETIRGKPKLHPATLVFQALRIAVNDELGSITQGLAEAVDRLSSGGRIGVISFHSLEDRIVKTLFKDASFVSKRDKTSQPVLRLLTKKPLIASDKETRANPRARSAKMRFAEKI
jgi:16S rRNA (cytosine1402-N4)-methyltransferase